MGRFSFPVPGRKKAQAVPVADTKAASKAHKLLGSTPLNIDAPAQKGWDVVSNSGISVTVTDTNSPTYSNDQNSQYGRKGSAAEWGVESDILPRDFRGDHLDPNEDSYSENTTALRSRPSSSTIRSWYDKTKQPLSVSQQTSASAMARGLPTKAQRMLDMDNSLAPQRNKKKPARLDLSSLTPSGRSKGHQGTDAYVLGPDMVTKSPSILSQSSPASSAGRRLQKRPTKESLRQRPSITISDPIRPSTAGSSRFPNHPNGVPDLYGHYEQMSLRQIMDLESHDSEVTQELPPMACQNTTPNPSIIRTSPSRRKGQNHGYTASQSTHSSKANRHSPSASVSSRHTRTSKASKRTDSSFQDADLHGKSILSLSSDSEDDDGYGDAPERSPTASVFARRPSDFEEHVASLEKWHSNASSITSASPEPRSKNGKRASFAPYHTYLPVPGEQSNPAANHFGTSPSAPSLLQPPSSSSRISSASNSSEGSGLTWQSNAADYDVQEARVVTMLPAQGPSEKDSPVESGPEWEQSEARRRSSIAYDSLGSTNDQPTPPLSPSSVDFYIRSAHSSIDGPSLGQNRFMAVSKQEELLLAALRQKRQLMRESFIAEEVSARMGRQSQIASKSHKTQPSTATITQDLFDFDFPAPPRSKDEISTSSSDFSGINGPAGSKMVRDGHEEDNVHSVLSPAPKRSSPKSILKVKSETQPRRYSQQSDDWPISPRSLFPDLEDGQLRSFEVDSRSFTSADSGFDDSQQILLPNRYSGGATRRKSSQILPARGHRTRPSVVPEEPISPPPSGHKHFEIEDVGVPRPDSPIAPENFPAIPSSRVTVNKKLARLSAVGSAPLGSEPGWWGDDD